MTVDILLNLENAAPVMFMQDKKWATWIQVFPLFFSLMLVEMAYQIALCEAATQCSLWLKCALATSYGMPTYTSQVVSTELIITIIKNGAEQCMVTAGKKKTL